MNAPRWILAAALVAIGTTAIAQQWKWRDSNGQVHVSDLPPPRGVQDKDILQKPSSSQYRLPPAAASAAAAPAASAAAKPRVDPELEARRKKAEQEQEAKAKAEEAAANAAKADNCRKARDHLRTLEDGMRIVRINEKGEREFMTDNERAAETQRTRSQISSNCQ